MDPEGVVYRVDNLTHGLAGALLAQAGFRQRYGAMATVALVIGAELPDIDVLFKLAGPIAGFVHHRGITHSLLGNVGVALLGAALLYGVRFCRPYGRLAWLLCLGGLLHIGMDYLNPYGTQIFLPFDAHHYAADAVFIIDYLYTAILVTSLLVIRMVRRQQQRRYARLSLVGMVLGGALWWSAPWFADTPLTLLALQGAGQYSVLSAAVVALAAWRGRQWCEDVTQRLGQTGMALWLGYIALCLVMHALALQQMRQSLSAYHDQITHIAVLPVPAGGAFVWRGVADTAAHYWISQIRTVPPRLKLPFTVITKGPEAAVLQALEGNRLVQVFHDFARFPVIDYQEQETGSTVRYFDLRFSGDWRPRSSLDLVVRLDPHGRIRVIEFLNRMFDPTHPDF